MSNDMFTAACGAALLMACSPAADADAHRPAPGRSGPAPLRLHPVVDGEATRFLRGELRCAFVDRRGDTLLIAAADVDRKGRSTAAITTDRGTLPLRGRGSGGFDALAKGAAFGGSGLTVRVAPLARSDPGTEETRRRGVLTLVDRRGAKRRHDGSWRCGP